MKARDFWRRVSDVPFQRELNRLFWIDAFQNGENFDLGWSCREHAWALTLLARAARLPAFVINGSLTHALASRDVSVLNNVGIHSWVAVEGEGFFDFSEKPTLSHPQGNFEHPIPKVIFSRPIPPSWGSVTIARSATDVGLAIDEAQRTRRDAAVYFGKTVDTPLAEAVEDANGFINSPLTDRLKSRFGPDIYAKAVLHLSEVLFSRRPSSSQTSTNDLWDQIDSEFSDAVPQVIRLARLT